MEYKKLNDRNKKCMIDGIHNDLNFQWEDDNLLDNIIRKFGDIYPYSSDPKEFIDDRYYLSEVNKLFKKLFDRKIDKYLFLNKLETLFKELLEKYPSLEYQSKYNINYYKTIISQSNRLIIKGCGGIGKSYFVYKLEEVLTENKIDHLCIYGKYNKTIPGIIYKEIENINKDFYFVIDALNEFNEEEQENILNNIKKIVNKSNINIIVTYRTYTLKDNIIKQLEKLLINNYDFMGVDFESSIIKLIEMYGIEAVRLIDVLESNNPLYLKMLQEVLFNSKIKKEELNSIGQMTFILERYIKKFCGLEYWKTIKDIGKYMFETSETSISEIELRKITRDKYDDFLDKMKQNDFLSSYEVDNTLYFVFSIQKLSDYIIARHLQVVIDGKTEEEIVEIINKKLDSMNSLHEAFALVLFDRYKNKDIRKVLRIIVKSKIGKELNLEIFRKILLDDKQIEYIQKSKKYKDIKMLFLLLGGYSNRPFNCKNYLNEKLINNFDIQKDIIIKYREPEYLIHLKNILYSLPFLDSETDILEEYFYYAFWLMSTHIERIRHLAIKVVYDILYKNNCFTNFLIDNYYKITDLYIKKGIIHVLTKLPKTKIVISFIEKVYYDNNEIDAEIVYRTAVYLEKSGEYQLLNKKNLNNLITTTSVDSKLDLKQIINIADSYDSSLLKFDRNPIGNTLKLYNNFIINSNKEIADYNNKLFDMFNCIKDDGFCKYSMRDDKLKKHLAPIDIIEIDSSRMFIIFQEEFKSICKIYNYNYYKKERFDDHFNKFTDSLLKKILLLTQDRVLGSLMTNYYTKEFSIYNDDITLGYKNYSYILYNEEKIYLASPISPYNELIDELNTKLCDNIGLYKDKNYMWYKSKNNSIMSCCNMTKPIIINNTSWNLIGGDIRMFIADHINVSYLCCMAFNPRESLIGDEKSRDLTIDNKTYYGNIEEYVFEDYNKSMHIPNFEFDSRDIKDTNLSFPSPNLIRYLDLKYNFRTSSWDDKDGNQVIICDNNSKSIYKYPVTGAIYIKTDILNKLKENNNIVYWCYTEKLYKNYGWNEDARLHIELDENGNAKKIFNNNHLTHSIKEYNSNCKNCKFGIYKEENKTSNNYFINIINYIEDNN